MFDLDMIEQDWLNHSHALTEEEIEQIFYDDGATIKQYDEAIDEWQKKTKVKFPKLTEEIYLLRMLDPNDEVVKKYEEQYERMKRLYEIKTNKYPEPKKKHLSKENQKKVIDGSMNLVFDQVRYYYEVFQNKISEEALYYLLVETLINITKYIVHCGKPVFHMYVLKSFKNSIIKYISRLQNISYKQAKNFVRHYEAMLTGIEIHYFSYDDDYIESFEIKTHQSEELLSIFEINYLLRNNKTNENIMENINTNIFLNDYNSILSELEKEEKMIMQLSYDIYGYPGLTYKEISEFLGISVSHVNNIKKRTLNKLRNNDLLNEYKSNLF